MTFTPNLTRGEATERLLRDAIEIDQILVLEVELMKAMAPEDAELSRALDSITEKVIENARNLHQVRREIRKADTLTD